MEAWFLEKAKGIRIYGFQPETSYWFSLGNDFQLNDKRKFCIGEQRRKTMNLTENMHDLEE